MARPRGPHGGGGDGGHPTGGHPGEGHHGEGGEAGEGGVPRQRGGQHGAPTSVNGIHQSVAEAGAAGRPGGAGSPAGRTGGPESEAGGPPRPQNDPDLDLNDPRTLAEITRARNAVADRLQQMADDAWDHVDTNRDAIFQQPGYQRMREDLVDRYGEAGADRVMESMVLGTEAHSHLANAVTTGASGMLDPSTGFRLRSEVNFDAQGVEVSAAPQDGFRPDVILERQATNRVTDQLDWEVAHAYDLKTGLKTGIEPSWSRKVTEALGLPNPPEELRPTQRPRE
ncbi:hypothetical protein [Micromonospora auratinigra]|uniref:hypothetical protein n=1 Tax=Micromonospora auratinigra TaxID=261654 RepID=UPI000AB470DE|nr:hypothetical protein [Micromonospora auratinigra]